MVTLDKHIVKYQAIAKDLRSRILRGQMRRGTCLPSASELTKKYGCSMTTINAALNLLEEQGVVNRVKGSGNYVGNGTPQITPWQIGLADMFSDEVDTLRREVVDIFPESALYYFHNNNCSCKVIPYFILRDNRRDYLDGLNGLLCSGSFIDDVTRDFLTELQIPIVIYKSEFEVSLPYATQVIPDFGPAAGKLFRISKDAGVKRVLIFHAQHANAVSRTEALRLSALSHGYESEQIGVYAVSDSVHSHFQMPAGVNCRGTLVISCSALDNSRILVSLQAQGLQCGDDYQFVCLDDVEHAEKTPYTITTLDYSRKAAAIKAAQCLINKLKSGDKSSYEIVKFPAQLTVRESAFAGKQKELV